jgi:hypothetical protein
VRTLVLLTPPPECDAIDAEVAQVQLEQLAKRGEDVSTIILAPGWTREVFRDDEVLVRLKETA